MTLDFNNPRLFCLIDNYKLMTFLKKYKES